MERGTLSWVADFLYATTQYPNGFTRPHVWYGHFSNNAIGTLHQLFFEELLQQEFKRTPFQLVFPGQRAGLIRTFDDTVWREYHLRFYEDGVIDCEEEEGRFNSMHYAGFRRHRLDVLDEALSNSQLEGWLRDSIRPLFGTKPYAASCIRRVNGDLPNK